MKILYKLLSISWYLPKIMKIKQYSYSRNVMQLSNNFYELHCYISDFIYNSQFFANFECLRACIFKWTCLIGSCSNENLFFLAVLKLDMKDWIQQRNWNDGKNLSYNINLLYIYEHCLVMLLFYMDNIYWTLFNSSISVSKENLWWPIGRYSGG